MTPRACFPDVFLDQMSPRCFLERSQTPFCLGLRTGVIDVYDIIHTFIETFEETYEFDDKIKEIEKQLDPIKPFDGKIPYESIPNLPQFIQIQNFPTSTQIEIYQQYLNSLRDEQIDTIRELQGIFKNIDFTYINSLLPGFKSKIQSDLPFLQELNNINVANIKF